MTSSCSGDGPSTTRFDSTAPIVAIDLSDLYNDNANLSIAFTCASAWMEAALATPGNGQRFAVYDEAWRVLAHAHGAIDRLQQQFPTCILDPARLFCRIDALAGLGQYRIDRFGGPVERFQQAGDAGLGGQL